MQHHIGYRDYLSYTPPPQRPHHNAGGANKLKVVEESISVLIMPTNRLFDCVVDLPNLSDVPIVLYSCPLGSHPCPTCLDQPS